MRSRQQRHSPRVHEGDAVGAACEQQRRQVCAAGHPLRQIVAPDGTVRACKVRPGRQEIMREMGGQFGAYPGVFVVNALPDARQVGAVGRSRKRRRKILHSVSALGIGVDRHAMQDQALHALRLRQCSLQRKHRAGGAAEHKHPFCCQPVGDVPDQLRVICHRPVLRHRAGAAVTWRVQRDRTAVACQQGKHSLVIARRQRRLVQHDQQGQGRVCRHRSVMQLPPVHGHVGFDHVDRG